MKSRSSKIWMFQVWCRIDNILSWFYRIIAVSYEARDFGVTRQMRGDDAKAKCPDINLVPVPQVRGKADLSK